MATTMVEDDENPTGKPEDLEPVITEEIVESSEDDDRLSSGDEEPEAESGNDAEREAIRGRRRLEKVERKDRRDKAIGRDKLELDFLRKRNDELERRVSVQEVRSHQVDLSNFDSHIAQARNEVEMAERVIAKAVDAGNGADVAQAMKYRDQSIQRTQQLEFAKQNAARQAPAQKPADGMSDLTLHYAKEFLKDNSWYDPQGRDEDSAIVLAIDQTLVRDGFAPDSEDYWDELRTRTARRLPEKFKPVKSDRTPRGGPAVGSGREHAPASTRSEIYISPDRKQALVDAGVWDDPILRMKYAKRYAEYDRNNKA